MSNKLAIIIPGYKSTFLAVALDSIAAQTCKDFTLYIGDDCSPHDLKGIVDRYVDKINLVYKRFDENLGGKDLVAQWERCIDMTHGEEWLWLFSDDDVMEPNCVEEFYNAIDKYKDNFDIYHFNVKVINNEDKVTRVPCLYPDILSSLGYYKGKMRGKYISLVVENIFSRNVYVNCGGFQHFDLAWGSDTATWIKFMQAKGMKTIYGPNIHWRLGSENISSSVSTNMVERKIKALNYFFQWTYNYFKALGHDVLITNIRAFIGRMSTFKHHCPVSYVRQATQTFCKEHNCQYLYLPIYILIKAANTK